MLAIQPPGSSGKKPGAIRLADLCTLGLLEADFNAGMKILVGHRVVRQALQSNLLPSECYGSVPGHRAIQVSLCRCLLADVSRQCRHPLVVVSEDAARCYDQIAHCPAALACQRLGVSPQVMVTIFATIQLMKFFLRTAYGDSATFYGGGLSQYPFQGVCQGNGAGPAIWLALSLCLIHMIHQFGYPNQLTSAISLSSIILVGFIYVDDCDLFVLTPPFQPGPTRGAHPTTKEYGHLARRPRIYRRIPLGGEMLLERAVLPLQSGTVETSYLHFLPSGSHYPGRPPSPPTQAL